MRSNPDGTRPRQRQKSRQGQTNDRPDSGTTMPKEAADSTSHSRITPAKSWTAGLGTAAIGPSEPCVLRAVQCTTWTHYCIVVYGLCKTAQSTPLRMNNQIRGEPDASPTHPSPLHLALWRGPPGLAAAHRGLLARLSGRLLLRALCTLHTLQCVSGGRLFGAHPPPTPCHVGAPAPRSNICETRHVGRRSEQRLPDDATSNNPWIRHLITRFPRLRLFVPEVPCRCHEPKSEPPPNCENPMVSSLPLVNNDNSNAE